MRDFVENEKDRFQASRTLILPIEIHFSEGYRSPTKLEAEMKGYLCVYAREYAYSIL